MPAIRIYIEDLSGNQIANTAALDTIDYATNLTFSSTAPGGCEECTFRLRRSDIYTGFAVKHSFGVVVQDGSSVLWQGRIEGMKKVTAGGDEYIDIRAVGWKVILAERTLRKRWIDPDALMHAVVPAARLANEDQIDFLPEKRENALTVQACRRDLNRASGEYYREDYTCFGNIRRFTFSYAGRCGEDFRLRIVNDGDSTVESDTSITLGTPETGSVDDTISGGATTVIQILAYIGQTNDYDQNDWIKYNNMTVYAHFHSSHSDYASPTYNVSNLVEDVLLLVLDKGDHLSSDITDIATVSTALGAFTVEELTPAAAIIERIIAYSDSSNNTYLYYVWDRTGTSDNLPRFELSAWSVADYEYYIDINDKNVSSASNEQDGRMLYNWIAVQYVDNYGRAITRTPDDNANLKDATSIANEYQREIVLKIGKATSTDADNIGEGFLAYHKTRKWRGSITLSKEVTAKSGARVPVEWVQASQRYYIPQFGETFFIRTCNISAETRQVTITPDLPPDDTETIINKLRTATNEAGRQPKYYGAG